MNVLPIVLALVQATASTGSVRGVILTDSDQPVYAARVELSGGPQGPLVTRTDMDGQFVFADLPRGGYRLSAKKEGFVRLEYGQKRIGGAGTPLVIEAGSQVSGINMHLQPAATITGEVRNEDGIPVANILVQALRRSYGVRGNRTVTLFSSTLTDDLGAYRLYWVDPGDYYVNASYLPQLPTPVNPNEDVARAAYSPTYFPGTSDPSTAQVVHLEPNNGRTVHFKLERSPAVTVSGTVRSALSGNPTRARVTLVAPGESASTVRYAMETDSKGFFEMKGVVAGTYVLSARTADGQGGNSRIQVLDIDRPRADVLVGPGVSLGARLFGPASPSANLSTVQVSLVSLETHIPSPEPGAIRANGNLTLENVQPGDYLLRVSGIPANGYVRAARSGSRDLLEEFVNVQYDNSATLDIQLAFEGGQLAGTVIDAGGKPVEETTVVLVPDAARRHRPDQYRVSSSGPDGQFSLGGIPPGDYKVFAWDSVESNAWVNANFMSNYEELGSAVSFGANAKTSAQIRVIPQSR